MDDEVIVDNKNSVAVFNYSFKLEPYYFNLVQINDSKFDIKINDCSFEDLKSAELSGELKKPKKNVKREEDDDDDEDNSHKKKGYKYNQEKNINNDNYDISYNNNNNEYKGLID